MFSDKSDDIRPDLNEDDTEIEDYRAVDTDDIMDDFPDLSEDDQSRERREGSSDSTSMDMVSIGPGKVNLMTFAY